MNSVVMIAFHYSQVIICFYTHIYITCRHEVAEAAGVVTYSFGMEGEDKHMVLFKKVIIFADLDYICSNLPLKCGGCVG